MVPTVSVQREDFDVATELEALSSGIGPSVGALASFVGLCRDEGGRLAVLELEHYPGMAEAEIGRLAADAASRWPLLGLTVIHRFGSIRPGERIVLVAAASSHRDAAFRATEFLMDFLKTSAPFWKREHLRGEGPGGGAAGWVEARDADDDAAGRWRTIASGPGA